MNQQLSAVRMCVCVCRYLIRDASVINEQQVLQVGVEQRTVDHGDAQPLLHDKAHRAVIGETDDG